MIFFDIDGTLIDHASASAAASLLFFDHFSGQVRSPREQFPAIWEEILMKHFNRFCRGEISIWEQRRARIREVFADASLAESECDTRYRVFIEHYESLTQPYSDAALALARLEGKRLGIISNGAREQQIGKLQRAGILQFFSVMVFSEDVGLGKPAPEIFHEACRRSGDGHADCIHIGDDLACDIEASQAVGITPIWLNRNGTTQHSAACTIPSLDELSAVLETKLCSV